MKSIVPLQAGLQGIPRCLAGPSRCLHNHLNAAPPSFAWALDHPVEEFFFFFFFFKIDLLYYKVRYTDIQRGGETERKIFCLMIHSPSGLATMADAVPIQSWEPGTCSGSSTWVQCPKALGHP